MNWNNLYSSNKSSFSSRHANNISNSSKKKKRKQVPIPPSSKTVTPITKKQKKKGNRAKKAKKKNKSQLATLDLEHHFKKQAPVQAQTLPSLQNSHFSHPISLPTQSLVQVQDQEAFHSIHRDDTEYD